MSDIVQAAPHLEDELTRANWDNPVVWMPLDELTEKRLEMPWVYYRPLGFGLVEPGSHDRIAQVLCHEEGWGNAPGGAASRLLMEVVPYAFRSSAATVNGRPPFYRVCGPLSRSEILALSATEPLEDFERWYWRQTVYRNEPVEKP